MTKKTTRVKKAQSVSNTTKKELKIMPKPQFTSKQYDELLDKTSDIFRNQILIVKGSDLEPYGEIQQKHALYNAISVCIKEQIPSHFIFEGAIAAFENILCPLYISELFYKIYERKYLFLFVDEYDFVKSLDNIK
jgi:hypothetical protein